MSSEVTPPEYSHAGDLAQQEAMAARDGVRLIVGPGESDFPRGHELSEDFQRAFLLSHRASRRRAYQSAQRRVG